MSDLCDYKDCLEPAEVEGLCRLHYVQDMDERQADKQRIAELELIIDSFKKGADFQVAKELQIELNAANTRIAELEAGYREAIEDIVDWSGYVSEYFTKKYYLAETLKKHRETLNLPEQTDE